ncbi:O-acyltransferase WSD1, C-terminal [Dillenia turbinata]|uniref:O-acyltransferase WSD1, C-terminal n=1 Tax=Dillenia turbinata TaxID=194707 RepID=A0AAN8UP70_9MAGN
MKASFNKVASYDYPSLCSRCVGLMLCVKLLHGRSDVPLSPTAKLFLQHDMYLVTNCVVCLENPLDVEAAKFSLKNFALIKHPRFCCLLVRDKNGEKHWRKIQVDLERHLIIPEDIVGEGEDEEEIVNQYMADLAISSPLSTDKPLQEFHFLMAHKCDAMRVYHALGGGISLMSLFLLVVGRLMILISLQGWQMQTTNDVFFAIVTSGLSRYLHHRMPEGANEPWSPFGRLFLQQELYEVVNLLVGLEKPIDVDATKMEINNSVLIKHPRFCGLLVRDEKGKEYWRKTQVDLDRHFIVLEDRVGEGEDEEEIVNQYMADLAVSSPLSTNKPLWEFHFLMAHKCVAMRFHHALGDGISLMSLLKAVFRKVGDPNEFPTMATSSASSPWDKNKFLMNLWNSFLYITTLILRILWIRDPKTAISGGPGVELWPRRIATAKLHLDDMKAVKKTVTGAKMQTINDVFFAILSSGLSRYLHHRTPTVQEGLQLTTVSMVNLRQQPGLQEVSNMMTSFSRARWGNDIGVHLLPLYYHRIVANPLDHLKKATSMLTKKKLSKEAISSHFLSVWLTHCFGSKVACSIISRLFCNTTICISNVIGFQEKMSFSGNPIEFLRMNTSSTPQAIQIHMVSYAGRADLQILVAKDIIPDPKFLAKCFEDSLLEMKATAAKLQS